MDLAMLDILPTLKALADESRLRIINLLLTHDLCVGAIAGHLKISKAAVSQHLQILLQGGELKPILYILYSLTLLLYMKKEMILMRYIQKRMY